MIPIIKPYKQGWILYDRDTRKYKKLSKTESETFLKDKLKDIDYVLIESISPLKVFWDITEECNARCIHCFTDSGTRADDELTTAQVVNVIDQLITNGIMSIAFSGGEPFIRSDMMHILQYAAQRNISISLTTNGSLMNEEIIKSIVQLNIKSVTISLDGLSGEIFGKIRKGINIVTILDNIKLMAKYSHHGQTEVNVRTTVNSLNYSEVFDILEFCSDNGVGCFKVNNTHLWGRAKENPFLQLEEKQFQDTIHALQKMSGKYNCRVELPVEKYLSVGKTNEHLGGCTSTIDTINIYANGDVGACGFCEKKLVFGNVTNDRISNILKNTIPFDFSNEVCERCAINNYKDTPKVSSALPFIN